MVDVQIISRSLLNAVSETAKAGAHLAWMKKLVA